MSAAWLPTTVLTPGLVVRIIDYGLEIVTSIGELTGDTEAVQVVEGGVGEAFLSISEDFSLDFNVAVPGAVTGSIGKQDGFLFVASGCRTHRLKHPLVAEALVLELHDARRWNRDFVLVTETYNTGAFSAVIAREADTRLTLEPAPSGLAAGALPVVPGGGIIVSKGSAAVFSVRGSATPMFRGRELPRRRGQQSLALHRGQQAVGLVDLDAIKQLSWELPLAEEVD